MTQGNSTDAFSVTSLFDGPIVICGQPMGEKKTANKKLTVCWIIEYQPN